MKIVFISTMAGVPWGGSELLWSETAKAAVAAGHEVMVTAYDWQPRPVPIQSLLDAGATASFRPVYDPSFKSRLINKGKQLLSNSTKEVKDLQAFKPDVVLLSQSGGYDLIFRPELKAYFLELDIPYFVICHNYDETRVLSSGDRLAMRTIYGKAQQLFLICDLQLQVLRRQLLDRLPNARIAANPVNLKKTGVVPYPVKEKISFACVASLHTDRKGQDLLLEVFSQAQWQGRDWELNFYGNGPDEDYLKAMTAFFGLEHRVHFKGHVSEIHELWEQNQILLISSRVETGPMVLMEAMLCGRAVIASAVGQVAERIQDGITGFIAGAATIPLLSETLETAWKKREGWQEMGAAAYRSLKDTIDFNAATTLLRYLTKQDGQAIS